MLYYEADKGIYNGYLQQEMDLRGMLLQSVNQICSEYSQENTCVCEILKNNIFDETPVVTASTITVSFGEEVVNSWIKTSRFKIH